jgi:hypothetical protein
MKKHTLMLLSLIAITVFITTLCTTSCKKKSNSGPTSDSAVFLFHLHTQIIDSTIGGNTDGYDSNTTGSTNPWYLDGLNRRIELFVPQFFVTNVILVNANGSTFTMKNVVVLKGLDSEDYYLGNVPVGTYVSAMFTVGLANADSTVPPSTLFITDGVPYPVESSMWNGTDYYGMKITGAYDTSAGATGKNPIPFSFEIPNSLTIPHQVVLPTRGTAAANDFPVYLATAGSTNYIHILCDYGKLLAAINLRTSNQTSVNPLIADSLANNLTNMYRYEQ